MRKMIEDLLYRYVPWTGVVPLYTMVSFGGMRYSDIWRKWVRQGRLLKISGWISVVATLVVGSYIRRKMMLNMR